MNLSFVRLKANVPIINAKIAYAMHSKLENKLGTFPYKTISLKLLINTYKGLNFNNNLILGGNIVIG